MIKNRLWSEMEQKTISEIEIMTEQEEGGK